MQLSNEAINSRVSYHKPGPRRIARHEEVRVAIRTAMEKLRDNLTDSRETALAMTNLEQAMFWANADIARNVKEEDEMPTLQQ